MLRKTLNLSFAIASLAIASNAHAWPSDNGAQTTFDVKKHGFNFVNYFEGDILVDVPLVGNVDLGDSSYGLCGGMTFAALDNFGCDAAAPDMDQPQSGSQMQSYLYGRQMDTFKKDDAFLIRRLISWGWRPIETTVGITGLHVLSDKQFKNEIAPGIDQGHPVPMLLIRADAGDYLPSYSSIKPEGFTKNHQVLAIGYRLCQQTSNMKKHWAIDIYDPNYPDKVCTLHYSDQKRGETLKYTASGALVNDLSQEKLEGFRGFYATPYSHKTPYWVPPSGLGGSLAGRLANFGRIKVAEKPDEDTTDATGPLIFGGKTAQDDDDDSTTPPVAAGDQAKHIAARLQRIQQQLTELDARLDKLEDGGGDAKVTSSSAQSTTQPSGSGGRGLGKNLPPIKASEGDTALGIRGKPGRDVEIAPNPKLKGRLGRIVVEFPADSKTSGTRIDVYKADDPKNSIAGEYGNVAAELIANSYVVVVSNKRVGPVEVKPQNDTRLLVGALRINADSKTRVDVFEAGSKDALIGNYGSFDVGLPPGQYEVQIAGQREAVTVKAGEITEF